MVQVAELPVLHLENTCSSGLTLAFFGVDLLSTRLVGSAVVWSPLCFLSVWVFYVLAIWC